VSALLNLYFHSADDRVSLLQDDSQFIFDFNQVQDGSNGDGEFIVANRETFPALIGTGTGMSVGRIGRESFP
jgi:hypothetical protein